MDEEFLKQYTDCVYFLASPLTCKKGIECEYRHSEVARLNPRECWYWLSGGCLNPACAFRHPPLDGYTQEASEPVTSSVPTKTTNVPCYYYFNGYCKNGDRCLFLHNTDSEEIQGQKVRRTASANSESLRLENKVFGRSDLVSAPLTIDHSKSEQELQSTALKVVPSQSSSHDISFSPDEEETIDPIGRKYSSAPEPGFVRSIDYVHESQSSDEQAYEDEIERDERSSPGFDVLVDGEEEILDSEGGHESRGDLIGHYSRYDFEYPDEYDPSYPDLEPHYQYNPNGGDIGSCYSKNFLCQPRAPRVFASDLNYGRRFVKMDPGLDYSGGSDIWDRLGTQVLIDDRPFCAGLSRKRKVSQSHRSLRLGSVMVKKIQAPKKKRRKEKRRFAKRQRLASEITKEQSTNEFNEFSGPKTLTQIREEKKRAGEERNCRRKSIDFEGPKPLSEILRDKRKC